MLRAMLRALPWLMAGLLLLATGGCGLPGDAGHGSGSSGSVAPGFSVRGIDGAPHSLADYRGRVVLVNFWATWCIPCRAEIPDLEHEARIHRSDPVAVLGMDWKESLGPVQEFIRGLGVTYPILLDADGHVYDAYRVSALPTTFVVDRQGRVVKSRLGIASRDEIESEIKAALTR